MPSLKIIPFRVEIQPHHDLWVQGARFGTIKRFETLSTGAKIAIVKMDHPQVKKLQRLPLSYLKTSVRHLIGTLQGVYFPHGRSVYLRDFSSNGRLYVTDDPSPNATRLLWCDTLDLEGSEET